MPIYEYECRKCRKRLETLQRVSEPSLTTCPECGGELKKLFSAPAFQFKGEGWYVTDYARKKEAGPKAGKSEEKAGEAAERSDKAPSEAASEARKEGKAETKAEKGASAEGAASKPGAGAAGR